MVRSCTRFNTRARGDHMAAKKKTTAVKATTRTKTGGAVSRYVKALQSKFGEMKALTIDDEAMAAAHIREFIPTGIDVLDWYILGRGGLPVGRMSEVFGEEGSGKTSLGYSAIAQVQRMGGMGVWGDPEMSFDDERARMFGVDTERLLILQPETLEEWFEQVKMTLKLHDPDEGPMLIVWDSIASMVTKGGIEREAGDRRVGDVPLVMSEELKKILPLLTRHRAHLMALNQVRAKIGVMYGDNTTTPGGKAPKFYASQRLQILGGKAVKNAKEEHIAKIVTYLGVKNRLAAPYLKGKVRLDYHVGFNNIWSTVWHAKRMKMIKCRADGFAGASVEGLAAYKESLEKLGWSSNVPLPEEADDVDLAVDEDPEAADDDADD